MIPNLDTLLSVMQAHGATRVYAKKLAPNDNSKNQVYLGGNYSALNILPYGGVYTDDESVAGSKRDRAKADIRFAWVNENGLYEAPKAQLILYPKYPEIRMSGFLAGCKNAPSDVMTVRDEGRVMFFGVVPDGQILGYASGATDPLSKEIWASTQYSEVGVFLEIPIQLGAGDTKTQLLDRLTQIYQQHWIPSQRLVKGVKQPYSAMNGGGYTLEAELGISPNGYAEPDFLGWEIKQYGVSDFENFRAKTPVTLMTPEPTGGIYKELGVTEFMRRFGYPDKSGKPDRVNFGGIYTQGRDFHADTGLRLQLTGYDFETGKINDMSGGIALLSKTDEVAALWKYPNILEHWNRKHAQAAYVPSLMRKPPPEYRYGPKILLCEGTDFNLFLNAIIEEAIYYDPGIKMEKASSPSPAIKRRSQFRVKHKDLLSIYHQHENRILTDFYR